MCKKAIAVVLTVGVLAINLTGCSIDDTLSEFGYSSAGEAASDIVDKAIEFAEDISTSDIKQEYINSGLKTAFDDLMTALDDSYEEYDYIIDTSSFEKIYEGSDEDENIALYMDSDGKVYIIDYNDGTSLMFYGDATIDFFKKYIEKATALEIQ